MTAMDLRVLNPAIFNFVSLMKKKGITYHLIYAGWRVLGIFAVAVALILIFTQKADGKKIRQRLKVTTEKSASTKSNRKTIKTDSIDERGKKWQKLSADSIVFIGNDVDSIIRFIPSSIKFAGYDKQATSRRETFHVINESAADLKKALIEIIYKDMKGRMLHKRKVNVVCDVPSGETRITDIPTWDTQFSFYYYLSNKPRRIASPYMVEFHPLYFYVGR
ncbi:MAG: hypothetical protein K2G90_08245 [Muribaculaceae bacterium]|nr:hypothetical protein [Muribaculaceae bacterium]